MLIEGRPEWLVPGAQVVEVSEDHWRTNTIDRVLKRDVVLANGTRYNADTLFRSAGQNQSATTLKSANDPDVVKLLAAVRREYDIGMAKCLLIKWCSSEHRSLEHLRDDDDLLRQAHRILSDVLGGE